MPLLGSRGAASTTGFGALANLGYFLRSSLRFRGSNNAYLSRTPSSAGNRRTFTISYWMKRGTLGTTQYVFAAGSGTNENTWFQAGAFDTNGTSFDATSLGTWTSSGGATTAVFRDPSAWYHFVWAVDTTQATASNRVKLWVNGVQQTTTTPTISQNADLAWNNSGVVHYIGARIDGGPLQFFDGYLAEIHNIDGQALTPSSFGKTDSATGQWVPKKYSGTYGTNGFYLKFDDSSAVGKDSSGNSNGWSTSGHSVTPGATYDLMTDVPTISATASNWATLNPLSLVGGASISNGNLTGATNTTNGAVVYGTIQIPGSGKWYWEVVPTSDGNQGFIGIEGQTYFTSVQPSSRVFYYGADGQRYIDSTNSSYGATYTNNDVIGVAVDVDGGSVTFYKNNASQGAITYTVSGKEMFPAFRDGSGASSMVFNVNFGQRPFAYTPPTGFKALNTFNLP